MPQIKKILFTTDLTDASRHAYPYALMLAERFDAPIIILHVMEDTSTGATTLKSFLGEARFRELQDSHEQEARQILIGKKREGAMIREALGALTEKLEKDQTGGKSRVEDIVVAHGNPVNEILSESVQRECDTIVMGHHARGTLEEAFLGSTARRVMRRSRIPVLLVRLEENQS